MATKIEWTNEVWNPVTGCTKVSSGCKNCYAEKMHKRLASMRIKKYAKPFNEVVVHPEVLEEPLHWRKPRMIFVNSMSDLFHPDVPFDFIYKIITIINDCPQHIFQALTKRPDRMMEYFSIGNINYKYPVKNLWLGVSVEDQKTADERIPLLVETPAAVRWISAEPLLSEIDIEEYLFAKELDWVVVGGESGPKARPMHPDWVRSIRNQCQAASVPFFFKQWGTYLPQEMRLAGLNKRVIQLEKIGKKKAGNLLDGKQYLEYP